MSWFKRIFRRYERMAPPQTQVCPDIPLALLVHTHSKDSRPPGTLEEGMVELLQDDLILHAVSGIVQEDGTIRDLPKEKMEWARQLTYRHLKREGCLAEFGIPLVAAYEDDVSG
jgi:hypothetical protein